MTVKYCGLLLLLSISLATAEDRISLDGTSWRLENANRSISTNGKVPGGVFSDLEDNGILKESIYYRLNDQVYKWVGRDNWTYSRYFDLPAEVLSKKVVNLVLHGADTIGQVWLNGNNIANISNMYVRYVIPIKDVAKPTGNLLEVRFWSPVTSAANIFVGQPHWYPPDCLDPNIVGECHINMLRKMPCSFGWDWGPPYASSGLWKSVEVEATNSVIIRDVTSQTVKVDDGFFKEWELSVTIFADLATESFTGTTKVTLHYPQGGKVTAESRIVNARAINNEYIATMKITTPQEKIALWWPNGYGDQALYDVDVSLEADGDDLVKKSFKVGFRTVEVVQDKITEGTDGNTFYFKVNDVPVFAKGANWIPSNLLPEKSYDRDWIRHLLLSAKEANMNMFRIWGGGIYESDTFYEIADEVGVMIWHDFMFSDAIYPVDDGFLSSVRTEVEQQIKRIQRHACVALWSGNNENESVLMWLFGQSPDLSMYQSDYRTLYIDTIKRALDQLDPIRYYVGSSPSNGLIEPSVGYMHPDAGSDLYGDSHYYNGGSDSWNPWSFPSFRFVSEYGYEGMNSFENIKKVSVASDWTINSNFSISRNRRDGTYDEISRLIDYHIPLPPDDGSLDFFQLYIYYSQVTQAMSIKTITEKFRRDRDMVDGDNKGRTMGALYWMFNDVWQAPTWSSIEFGGRWKLLHYYAKNFFAPALVSLAATQDGKLDVFLVSDLKEDLQNVGVHIMVHNFDSFDMKYLQSLDNLKMDAGVSKSVWHTDSISELLTTSGCAPNTCFIHVQLLNGDQLLSENFWFPSRFHDVKLSDANVKVEITETSATGVSLKLTADRIAPFVWLETAVDGMFSDNGFTMTAAEEVITFRTRGETLDQTAFAQSLTVRDLTSTKPKNIV